METPVAVQLQSGTNVSSRLNSAWIWDSIGYFGSKVIPGLMGLLSVTVFIRVLGVTEYGRLAVVLPLLMAIGSASSGWLAQGILRFHPAANDDMTKRRNFQRAITKGRLHALGIAAILVAGLLAGFHYRVTSIIISLGFCFALVAYSVILSELQAQFQPVLVLRQEVVRSIASVVVPLFLIRIIGQKQFEWVILGQAIAYGFPILLVLRWRDSRSEAEEFTPLPTPDALATRRTIQQIWRFGWAVGAWLLLSQLLPVIDRWAIQRFAGYSSAGTYASLYEVSIRSFSFLLFPLTQAAHPRIMGLSNEGDYAEAYKLIRHSILSQFLIFIVAFGTAWALAPWITRHILGFDDPVAAHMLPVLLTGGFLWQLALLLHKPMEIAHQTGAMLAGMALVLVINLISCLTLIPLFGYQVAAYILVLSGLCYALFTLIMTRFSILRFTAPAANLA